MKRGGSFVGMLAVIIAAGVNLTVAKASDDPSLGTVHHLLQKMQAAAAPGWTVTYDEKLKIMEVTRKELTPISSNIPNPAPGGDDTRIDHFSFWLSVTPLVTRAEYTKQAAENHRTEKKIAEVYARLVASPTVGGIQRPHGPPIMESGPSSDNPADQTNIVEYEYLKNSLHDLPDGYFDDISLRWDGQFPTGTFGPAPSDEAVRHECEKLYRKLAAVIAPY